jgi:hypothetical protein
MLFLLAMLAFAPGSRAEAPLLTKPDAACACDPHLADPLEEPVRFAYGKFVGECVDSCRFRRARIVEDKVGPITVGNILHRGKYLRARIDPSQVRQVQAGFERFAPGVDHVFLRFEMAEDIPLFAQDGRGPQLGSTRSLVISSEGVPPKKHHYSLLEAYFGYYILADRIVTGEELTAWTRKLRHPTQLYDLSLTPSQAGAVLRSGIQRSESESFHSAYRLFANNCSTSALSLLDAATGYQRSGWDLFGWAEFEAALPVAGYFGTARALRERKLIAPQTTAHDLYSAEESKK